jgi:hypothetical protein
MQSDRRLQIGNGREPTTIKCLTNCFFFKRAELYSAFRAFSALKGGYKMHSHLNDPIVIKYWIFLIWEFLSITAMVALGIIALNVYFKRPF